LKKTDNIKKISRSPVERNDVAISRIFKEIRECFASTVETTYGILHKLLITYNRGKIWIVVSLM
jgi:hypothetical protein